MAGPVSAWMVRELAPRPGDTVLELAAGVGDTGFAAARLVASNGRLICTDFSPAMLDAARRRGDELGLRNVDSNPFFALVAMSLARRGHIPPPDPEGPGIFSMASDERTTALLEGAGFEEVRTDEVKARFAFDDVDEYLTFIRDTAGPIALALRGLSEEQRREISDDVEEAAAPFATEDGYVLPGVSLVAAAR